MSYFVILFFKNARPEPMAGMDNVSPVSRDNSTQVLEDNGVPSVPRDLTRTSQGLLPVNRAV